jgi:hypothetical protein
MTSGKEGRGRLQTVSGFSEISVVSLSDKDNDDNDTADDEKEASETLSSTSLVPVSMSWFSGI